MSPGEGAQDSGRAPRSRRRGVLIHSGDVACDAVDCVDGGSGDGDVHPEWLAMAATSAR